MSDVAAHTLETAERPESVSGSEGGWDAGPSRAKRQPERTCIVTRKVGSPDELIRFVAAPDGTVVPDLKRRLPGRGVWVSANAKTVREAIRRKAFARGLKTEVRVADDLPDVVDRLLGETALRSLSMARKAGALVTGSAKIDGLIRTDECAVLIHAHDASADGTRKLDQAVTAVGHLGGREVAVTSPFTVEELSSTLGLHNVVHAALRRGRAGEGAHRDLEALAAYRGEADPPPELPPDDDRNDTS